MRNFVITLAIVAACALGAGLLAKSAMQTQTAQTTCKKACTFFNAKSARKRSANWKLAKRVKIAKAGSYDLMYQLWRALTLSQGVSIDGAEPKEQVSEDALRQERSQLVKSELRQLQSNMAAILRISDSEVASATGDTQTGWKSVQKHATSAATALRKLSDAYAQELKTEEQKEEADKVFGSQALFYADAIYELDQASRVLRSQKQ